MFAGGSSLHPETADIYVVLLSSIRTESDCQSDGLEHGADGYIARPIPNRELLARVESILRLKYVEDRLRQSEQRFRAMFEKHSAVMLLIEPETGRIIDSNRLRSSSTVTQCLSYTRWLSRRSMSYLLMR